MQFFYPNVETNLCLHGALAAVVLLMSQRRVNHITVSNAVGKLLQAIKLDDKVVQIKVSAEPAPTYNPDQKVLKQLLSLTDLGEISTDFPMTVASVGSPKVLVPLRTAEALATLRPNFDLIKQWSLCLALGSADPLLLQARRI